MTYSGLLCHEGNDADGNIKNKNEARMYLSTTQDVKNILLAGGDNPGNGSDT